MNRASLEHGMFRSEHARSYKAEVENKEESEKRRRFEEIVNFGRIPSKIGRVDSLDEDGFPFVGANLQSGDIVIGRFSDSKADHVLADHSIKLKHTERGMVQKVVLSSNDKGKNFTVVSLRQVRSPYLGDILKHAWAKGCSWLPGITRKFPFHQTANSSRYSYKPPCLSFTSNTWSTFGGSLGKGNCLWWNNEICNPFIHSLY